MVCQSPWGLRLTRNGQFEFLLPIGSVLSEGSRAGAVQQQLDGFMERGEAVIRKSRDAMAQLGSLAHKTEEHEQQLLDHQQELWIHDACPGSHTTGGWGMGVSLSCQVVL